MNDTIIIENNSGLWAQIGRIARNRAFLGMLVLLLGSWNFYKYWWQEDVCAARYKRADAVFKKQNARKNLKVERGAVGSQALDRLAEKARAAKQQRAKAVSDRHKTDAVLPAKNHGAIQEVR